jgi:pimeloyl-ACP methyl ester carboxylesterase
MTIRDRAEALASVQETRKLGAWTYGVAGQGPAVLLLAGGTGIGIGWLDLVLALHSDYRTIAVDYPPGVSTIDELAQGVLDVLDAENIEAAHIVGQSAGGMLAEMVSRAAPDRVRSMTLTGTGLYGDEDVARLEQKLAALEAAPWEQTRAAMATSLRAAWQDADEADFWIGRIDQAVSQEGLVNSYRYLLDVARRADRLRPAWQGPVLLLRAGDDPLITEAHTQRLANLHPGAEIRVLPSGGHSLLVSRPGEYITAVREFLA